MAKIKNGTLVIFNGEVLQINGYDKVHNVYALGSYTENKHLEPETAFTVIKVGDKPAEQEQMIHSVKDLNMRLYGVLCDLFNSHRNMEGKLDYHQKDHESIGDTMDYIKIKYLGEEPDGDREEELAANTEEPMLNDEEAYFDMVTRFNNLTF